jgi:endonuclease/exonuclease/phosphatase family metal-dependent hydrolase
VKRVFRWINILLLAGILLAFLAPWVSPDLFWPAGFLTLSLPWLLLLNLLFVLGWALLGQKEWYYSLIALALGIPSLRKLLSVFPANTEYIGKTELAVTTFNVQGMLDQEGKPEWVDMESQWAPFPVLNLTDVLCLQEFTSNAKKRAHYLQWIAEQTGMKHQLYEPGHGLVICSAYPLRRVDFQRFGNRNNGYLIADIEIEGRTVRLINVHLESNDVTRLAQNVMEEGRLQERETWVQVKGMAGRYRRSVKLRARQAGAIRQLMAESPHPVLLCGDFNDVPTSYVYQKLSRNMNDSFRQAGLGLGVTYRGKIPGLRIDYILAPESWAVHMHQVSDAAFSDHRAVNAILLMP